MSSASSRSPGALEALRALHAEIDAESTRLAAVHGNRLRCGRGCASCCVDDLTVAAVEAHRIRTAHAGLLREGEPHPPGACAFLSEAGACRVYEDRPSVCRTQGLPLRFFVENERDEVEERRDICELNREGGPPLDRLEESSLWLVGPFELRLREIDVAFTGEEDTDARRVPLRRLFERSRRPTGGDRS